MSVVEVVDAELNYLLIRSERRKTVGLYVKQGKVTVRAPYYLDQKHIDALVQKKLLWLKSKLEEQSQNQITTPRLFVDGSYLWVFGQYTKVTVIYGKKNQVNHLQVNNLPVNDLPVNDLTDELQIVLAKPKHSSISDQEILSRVNVQEQRLKVKKQLEKWFKNQAETYIAENLPYFSAKTKLTPKSFKVRQYKARWGSCNSKKELSFNYLLMMVPTWVIDYVIIHELCHLEHLNHSAKFWQLVEQHYPLYQAAKIWMKTHQSQLQWTLEV